MRCLLASTTYTLPELSAATPSGLLNSPPCEPVLTPLVQLAATVQISGPLPPLTPDPHIRREALRVKLKSVPSGGRACLTIVSAPLLGVGVGVWVGVGVGVGVSVPFPERIVPKSPTALHSVVEGQATP